ncbi:MAG: HlyD family efflux transporter periplasmic adaptor subunit [Firmicutes bacterium]|nr:HlyD family efflux transporter periplasmic adaptor subunit [Bacillota bacterium]
MKKTLAVIGCSIAAVLAVIIFYCVGSDTVQVTAYTLSESSFDRRIICSGTVEADCESGISPERDAVVEKVLVQQGEFVEKGDKLIKLVSSGSGEKYLSADRSGVVVSIAADRGKTASAGVTLAVIAQPDDMTVRIKVPQSNAGDISIGKSVIVRADGLEREYHGTVEKIYHYATKSAGGNTTLDAVIAIDDADDAVTVGFTAKVEIVTEQVDGAVIIPLKAVGNDKMGDYVYIISGGKASKSYFNYSEILPEGYVAESGVKTGDIVVDDISFISGNNVKVVY